ncbi:hypothetical protein CALCODRAFT_320165 [Calocera cornea HHB12733]|uniref:Uncharacterized protein n=1 Tax=Calocera cornea HHB12733 TaxID=1353952 RepID=A0A165F895_9BASI|nr:hypothetical protein CALCODRAFT_320165 [Calocera cornea HHB12733]
MLRQRGGFAALGGLLLRQRTPAAANVICCSSARYSARFVSGLHSLLILLQPPNYLCPAIPGVLLHPGPPGRPGLPLSP